MLKFDGILRNKGLAFLVLSNDIGEKVEIPIELPIADRINKYLNKIAAPVVLKPEDLNVESSEQYREDL